MSLMTWASAPYSLAKYSARYLTPLPASTPKRLPSAMSWSIWQAPFQLPQDRSIPSVRSLFRTPEFPALHEEAGHRAEGDGVDAVGVAVEVELEDAVGVVDVEVRAHARRGLVLGAVHADPRALVGAGFQEEVVHRVRAGHGAAEPAAVRQVLGEELLPDPGGHLGPLGVLAVLVVLGRQEVVVVHDLHEVGGALLSHLALLVVVDDDLTVELEADALDGRGIRGAV